MFNDTLLVCDYTLRAISQPAQPPGSTCDAAACVNEKENEKKQTTQSILPFFFFFLKGQQSRAQLYNITSSD